MERGKAPRKGAGLCLTARKSPTVEELWQFSGEGAILPTQGAPF